MFLYFFALNLYYIQFNKTCILSEFYHRRFYFVSLEENRRDSEETHLMNICLRSQMFILLDFFFCVTKKYIDVFII